MNNLTKSLIQPFLESYSENISLIPGGFKPPTLGHFYLVNEIAKKPEIDKIIILVGSGVRDEITQEQSIKIWDIYKKYLPSNIEITPSSSPVKDTINIIKNNPQNFYFPVVGVRGEEDEKDTKRFDYLKGRYENYQPIFFKSELKISGTKARSSLAQNNFEDFNRYIPLELSVEDKRQVWDILKQPSNIKENTTYSQYIDYKQQIKNLTKYYLIKYPNIKTLPKVVFKHGDSENAKDFFGKTAYYNPNTKEIILYTEGRHPKDLVRSFSHEFIHFIQDIENRLGDVSTTNTMEDDNIDKLEQEANLKGTMTFRNWTDSLQESLYLDIPKFNQPKTFVDKLYESLNEITLSKDNAVEINGDLTGGKFNVGNKTYEYSIKNIPNPYKDLGTFYNIQFTPEENITSKPTKDTDPKDYIKILSTMYKIIVDFVEKEKPEYIGIASLDNTGDKNYHKIYATLTDNKYNRISGYFRKDVNLKFNTPEGKGRFVVLKKKDSLDEKKSKDPFGLNAYTMELGRLKEEETQYTIYCDLDGVLVDFNQGYKNLTGITPEQANQLGKEKFWEPIAKSGAKFWITLKWMKDGKQLWDYIKKYDPKLLSAPSREESSRIGKRVWVKRELPGVKLILRNADQKQQFATPTSILIDDRKENIEQWENKGGIGIFHTDTQSTINKLKKLGL